MTKVTDFNPNGLPLALGGWSTGYSSIGSNTDSNPPLSALNFVQRITANTSNTLLNPIVNFASGSGVSLAAASNTITISATGGGSGTISAGSNSTQVQEISTAGASSSLWSPFDHAHAGIGTVTASSSNTLQRGTFNIRPGSGIAIGLTDTDGDGEFDTATISNTGATGPQGPAGSGGALVFLGAFTASGSSTTLDCTGFISSTYDTYKIEGFDISLATNGSTFQFQAGTGGGPTYDTGNNYEWVRRGKTTGGADSDDFGSTGLANVFPSMSNNSGYGFGTFSLTFTNPQSTTRRRTMHGTLEFVNSTPAAIYGAYGLQYTLVGTAMTAIRFNSSSGNIASGTIRIYGISKS